MAITYGRMENLSLDNGPWANLMADVSFSGPRVKPTMEIASMVKSIDEVCFVSDIVKLISLLRTMLVVSLSL